MITCPKCGSGSGLRRVFYIPNRKLTEEFISCDDCGEGRNTVYIDRTKPETAGVASLKKIEPTATAARMIEQNRMTRKAHQGMVDRKSLAAGEDDSDDAEVVEDLEEGGLL